MPLYPTDETVTAQELAEIAKSWSGSGLLEHGVVFHVDAGEYRLCEDGRWQLWVYRDI